MKRILAASLIMALLCPAILPVTVMAEEAPEDLYFDYRLRD